MLAVIAARTRMHSRPSRNTRTPMSRKATVGLVFGCVGSGVPLAVTPCHMITAATQVAVAIIPMRNASFIDDEPTTSASRLLPFDCFFLAASCAILRGQWFLGVVVARMVFAWPNTPWAIIWKARVSDFGADVAALACAPCK